MGTARASSRRSVIAVALVSAFVMLAPVVVFAQEGPQQEQKCSENPKQPKCNSLCWRKEQCDKESGKENERGRWEQNKESDATCGGSPWGYCYPPNIETKLQIPIGEARDVADVGKYIKTVYLFLLGIGGLVGAIMLIHAGFLWMASGGNTASVELAKKHIQDAAIGLLLLFGSYTILSSINPNFVKLRVPKAQLLRNVALEFEKSKKMQPFDKCVAGDPSSEAACKNACQGCECRKENVPPMVRAIQVVQVAQMLVAGGLVLAEAPAVAQVGVKALNTVGKGMAFVFKKTLSLCSKGLKLAVLCGLGANAGIDELAATFNKEEALCVQYQSNAPNGVTCAEAKECASQTCLKTQILGGYGLCADGKEGSPCIDASNCKPESPVCADGPNDSKWCATERNRPKGSPCHAEENGGVITSECGAGLGCQVQEGDVFTLSTKEGIGWCVSAREAAGGPPQYVGDSCSGVDCPVGLRCQAWEFGKAETCNSVCDSDEFCAAACPSGEQCYCGDASPRICVKGARVAVAPAQVEILQNGGSGCANQAAYRCADGLICTADAILYRDGANVREAHVCTDKQPGSLCSANEECNSNRCESAGELPNGDPELKCV